MDRHQAEGPCQPRVKPRFADRPVVKYPPIKCLVLRPYRCEQMVGAEVSGRHSTKPEYGIGQSAMEPRKALVDDKAVWIDNDVAGIEFRLQNIRKGFD